ncbi:unnamed protein product [Caenorhabditis nigoni]
MNWAYKICLIFIVISSLSVNVYISDDSLTDSEIRKGMARQACWKSGGVIHNSWDQDNILMTSMKAQKDGDHVTVFNYGMQYWKPHVKVHPETVNTVPLFLSQNGKNSGAWATGRSSEMNCERVLDYKCLQDITINSLESLEKFNSMKCTELKKDLIIDGFKHQAQDKGSFSFRGFENIRKIRGRLVIQNVETDASFKFEKLIQVGQFADKKELPSIQIRDNVMGRIGIERVNITNCYPGAPKTCVSIQDNWSIENNDNPLIIKFKNFTAPPRWNPVEEIHAEPETERYEAEVERLEEHPEEIEKTYDQPELNDEDVDLKCRICFIPNSSLGYVAIAAMIGLIIWIILSFKKKRVSYDFATVYGADDKDNQDNYFAVDGKKDNKEKDSGMDDLGSN